MEETEDFREDNLDFYKWAQITGQHTRTPTIITVATWPTLALVEFIPSFWPLSKHYHNKTMLTIVPNRLMYFV